MDGVQAEMREFDQHAHVAESLRHAPSLRLADLCGQGTMTGKRLRRGCLKTDHPARG